MRKRNTTDQDLSPMADINITPLVDVTFFILIIFLLIAPLIEHGINVNLPEASAKKLEKPESLTVSVRKTEDGPRIYLENERLTLSELRERLKTIAGSTPDTALILRADKQLQYDTVVQVLDIITDAGITKLGMATVTVQKK
jgi:biopolymer transport protein ExbD